MKATNVVSISKGKKLCICCEDRIAELPDGHCRDCVEDAERESIIDAAMRAEQLGICYECFMETCADAARMIMRKQSCENEATIQ
jgi:hypothetical protein